MFTLRYMTSIIVLRDVNVLIISGDKVTVQKTIFWQLEYNVLLGDLNM